MPDITLTLTEADHSRAVAALAAATGGLSIEDALMAHIAATVANVERTAAIQAAVESVDVPPLAAASRVEAAMQALRAPETARTTPDNEDAREAANAAIRDAEQAALDNADNL